MKDANEEIMRANRRGVKHSRAGEPMKVQRMSFMSAQQTCVKHSRASWI